MKKKIIFAIIAVIIFTLSATGCDSKIEELRETNTTISVDPYEWENSTFFIVEDTPKWKIVCHRKTHVLYIASHTCKGSEDVFTVMLDADGKPLLYGEKVLDTNSPEKE